MVDDAARPGLAFVLGWEVGNVGGVNEVVRNLIREDRNGGVLTPFVIEVLDQPATAADADGVSVFRLSFPAIYDRRFPMMSLLKSLAKLPLLFWQLRSLCRRHAIQVLNPHFVGIEHLSLVLFKKLGLFRGRVLLSFHGSDIRAMLQTKGLERRLSRLLLRGADQLVACSEGLAQEISLLVPECAGRIAAIPNGIDVQRFLANASADFPLPPEFQNRKRILNVGAFEYKKGHDVLVKAFAQVRLKHSDVCLILAGQTRDKFDSTRQLIAELRLSQDVLLLRDLPHSQILPLLRSAELFVLSSRWEKGVYGEGFAMALLEAAAAGKPVVSTRSCGVEELIADGVSGSLVPTDDPGRLAEAIIRMLNDPEDAARQAKNLHQRVVRDFTWRAAYERYLKIALSDSGFSAIKM